MAFLSALSCAVGQPGGCALVLCAYTAYSTPVSFGGLKLSVTLDGAYTVDAVDQRNGNYSVAVPLQWSQRVGKHTLTINAGGKPIVFTGTGLRTNPTPLTVSAIECANGTDTVPDATGLRCVCRPGLPRGTRGQCVACVTGQTFANSKTSSCVICKVCGSGQVQTSSCSITTNTQCRSCSSGTVVEGGKCVAYTTCDASKRQVPALKCTTSVDTVCTPCGAASFVNGSACTPCRSCPSGVSVVSACSATANTACGACKAGTQLQTQGSISACAQCPTGKVSVDGQPCRGCSGGKVPTADQHACASVGVRCDSQRYYDAVSSSCKKCGVGQTVNGKSTGCVCVAGKYAASFGVVNCFSAGYFSGQQSNEMVHLQDGLSCLQCPSCMDCFDGQLHLRSGWTVNSHRKNASSIEAVGVYRCPRANVCPASDFHAVDCHNSLTGKFCAACQQGFFRQRSTRSCASCESETSSTSVWIVVIVAAFALIFALQSSAANLVYQAGVKIVLGYMQVMSQLGSVLNLNYEAKLPYFASALKYAGSLFFGVSDVFHRVRCTLDFYELFFADVLGIPLLLLRLVWLKDRLLDRKRMATQPGETKHIRRISAFFIAFLLYPSISQKIFTVFVCRRFGPDDEGWLEVDYSIDCASSKYKLLRNAAYVLVALIPVGLPALFAVLMIQQRKRLLEFQELNVGVISQTSRDDIRKEKVDKKGRAIALLEANSGHRDWPWKDCYPAAMSPWISAVAPPPIGHISERGVSTSFLRSFTEEKCRRNPTMRSVHRDIVLKETVFNHSRYVTLINGKLDDSGRPLVGARRRSSSAIAGTARGSHWLMPCSCIRPSSSNRVNQNHIIGSMYLLCSSTRARRMRRTGSRPSRAPSCRASKAPMT